MRRLVVPFSLFMLGSIAVAGVLGVPPTNAASANTGTQIVRILSGVIGYARWPVPLEKYRFCSAGEQRHQQDIQDNLKSIDGHFLIFRQISDESEWMANCDILYLGPMSVAERRNLLSKAVGHPILTISEDDSLCADATMFCLAMQEEDVRLRANLDTISRSAIRINPKVLQLVQRKRNQP